MEFQKQKRVDEKRQHLIICAEYLEEDLEVLPFNSVDEFVNERIKKTHISWLLIEFSY